MKINTEGELVDVRYKEIRFKQNVIVPLKLTLTLPSIYVQSSKLKWNLVTSLIIVLCPQQRQCVSVNFLYNRTITEICMDIAFKHTSDLTSKVIHGFAICLRASDFKNSTVTTAGILKRRFCLTAATFYVISNTSRALK